MNITTSSVDGQLNHNFEQTPKVGKYQCKPSLLGNSLGSSQILLVWPMPIMISWGNPKSLNCPVSGDEILIARGWRARGGGCYLDIAAIAVTMDAYSGTVEIRILLDI